MSATWYQRMTQEYIGWDLYMGDDWVIMFTNLKPHRTDHVLLRPYIDRYLHIKADVSIHIPLLDSVTDIQRDDSWNLYCKEVVRLVVIGEI